MAGRAVQSKWCSDACRQAAYRLRRGQTPDETEDPLVYTAPRVVFTVAQGIDDWIVHFDDGQQVPVEGCRWEGQARSRARWAVAQRAWA